MPNQGTPQSLLEELRTINNLLNRICLLRETNHIMSAIISEMIRITSADQGVISIVEPSRGDELQTVVRNEDNEPSTLPYKIDRLLSGWVLKNRCLLKIDDLDRDERFDDLSSAEGRIKSVICIPLVVRDEIVGLTTLIRTAAKGPFGDEQCRLVGILSSQSAQILYNARLIEDLARKNELLELSYDKLHEENLRLRAEAGTASSFENIIGKSPALRNVLTLASKFAGGNSPVLITGETGTGKELVARAIHYAGARKNKPFVVKNCGLKTESLLESELFGHVKGSFTGAVKDKIGLFKEADGGTIFLDEIGDAPLATQAAILRVIQHGEFRPIGSSKTGHTDVRVISATNKDLEKEIKDGNFREDLFYRLSTFSIDLPPLRTRKEDIPLLVKHFLGKLQIKTGNDQLSISSAAMDILVSYSWPGNIRQLENELERAAIICDAARQIDIGHLSKELIINAGLRQEYRIPQGSLQEIVERVERDIITASLRQHDGNIMQTSKALGLTRKGLKNKIARYKIKDRMNGD
jgi:transcriptional regulator with GAF, ATPase, and Fis domain